MSPESQRNPLEGKPKEEYSEIYTLLHDGIGQLLRNNQVSAISFEGGILISEEKKRASRKRAEEIEKQFLNLLPRIKTEVVYQIIAMTWEIRRIVAQFSQGNMTSSSLEEGYWSEVENLGREREVRPKGAVCALRQTVNGVTIDLCITDRQTDPSSIKLNTQTESRGAFNAFGLTQLANNNIVISRKDEKGRIVSRRIPRENKGNTMLISMPIPDSFLQITDTQDMISKVKDILPERMKQEGGCIISVTTRGFDCDIEQKDGELILERQTRNTKRNELIDDPTEKIKVMKEIFHLFS